MHHIRPRLPRIACFACALPLFVGCARPGAASAEPIQPEQPGVPASPPPRASATPTDRPGAQPTAPVVGPRTLAPEDLKGLAWRSIGPANCGGRIAAITMAPGESKTFYVGYGTGGLWKTTNNATTLSPLFDKEATSSIGSIAVADAPPDWPGWKDELSEQPPAGAAAAPRNKDKEKNKAKGKIVWVGTGEGNGRNSSSWGRGVYRSTDAGETFTNVGLNDSHDIPALAVDPRNPDICYAAALGHLWGPNKERGVYKTTDAGKTWKPVLQIDDKTGACDVILDPQNPSTVYAAMYTRRRTAWSFRSGGENGGIYRSRDAGATWTKLAGGLPPQTGRIGLDIFRKDPKVIYAVVESDLGGWGVSTIDDDRSKAGGVFRSDDGGESWKRQSPYSPRAFYFSKVRVDPANDQRVYLLGFTLWISDDAGRTFRAGGARKPHGDMHALAIDPADTDHLLMGTDGGLYASYDAGRSWDFIDSLATGQFYNVAFDMSDPYRVMGGLQDNGTWMGPSATSYDDGPEPDAPGEKLAAITNHDWRFIWDGDGYHVAFDPFDPSILYAEFQGGGLERTRLDIARRKALRPSPKEGQPRFRFNWNSPFFVSPHSRKETGTTIYFGGNYVFKLTEAGDKWERISDDLSTRNLEKVETVGSEAETHGTVVSLAESPLAPGLLWAGTDDGLVHLTTNDGKSWANVTPPEASGLYISRIEASHHNQDTAYVSIDGHRSDDMRPHLYVTSDAGKAWKRIVGDLPTGAPIKVVREDRWSPAVLFVGTEASAFVSIDAGAHWVRMNSESLPTVPVDDIAQHPREHDLIVGTHGRSIYILDDASPLSQLTPEIVNKPFHLFNVLPSKPRRFLHAGGIWSNRMFTAPNPPMGARITYWLKDFSTEDIGLEIEDAAGRAVRKLEASGVRGLNRVVWDLQPEKFDRMPNPEQDARRILFVPPGQYKVTLSVGKQKTSTTITVLPSPYDDDR